MTVVRATRDLAIVVCALFLLATASLACDDGPEAAGVAVVDPWVRAAIRPDGEATDAPPIHTAGYMVLRNAGPDPVVLVAVDTDVADTVELHGISMDGDVMRMRAVDSLAIAAGSEEALEPGGLHLMLIDIDRALAEGDTVLLVMRLRSGDTIPVRTPVRRAPPGGGGRP